METNAKIESCSHSNPEYSIPGNLFLANDWEERNPTPHSGVLTLRKDYYECEAVSDNI